MSQIEEMLKKSIDQSNSFRDMAYQVYEWCNLLIDEVKKLRVQNEELKEEIKELKGNGT